MDFVDEVKIFVKSGDGGHGCVSFRREKFVPRGGPDGGNGGKGGDVVIVADSQSMNLYDLRHKKHHRAKRGGNGGGADCHGRDGEECVVHVPPGTVIFSDDKSEVLADLDEFGARYVAAKGGRGGKGNAFFTSSTNRAPRMAQDGEEGEERWLVLELKAIADVGLLGFPSVGKSTLITAISAARPKIAPYPFTTLVPHLGAVDRDPTRRFIVADIPGLIEGAHQGVGLGLKFLRHIERTRVLIHVLDMDPHSGREPVSDFDVLNDELGSYKAELLEKPQIIAANKCDLPEAAERLKKTVAAFRRRKRKVFPISAKDGSGLAELLDEVERVLTEAERALAEADHPPTRRRVKRS